LPLTEVIPFDVELLEPENHATIPPRWFAPLVEDGVTVQVVFDPFPTQDVV